MHDHAETCRAAPSRRVFSSRLLSLGRGAAAAVTSSRLPRETLRRLAAAGLLSRRVWRRLPVESTFSVRVSDDGACFRYHSVAEDVIGRALYWRGLAEWEAETIGVFLTLAQHARRIIDVGANTGVYSLLACAVNPRAEVLSFEPVPHIFEKLRRNIDLNDFSSRCQALKSAVSDRVGTASLHVPDVPLPTSATLGQQGFREKRGTVVDVDVTTLDEACRDCDDVDLVKIDVEGCEHQVLGGMTRMVETCRPAIIVECNPDGPYRKILEQLAPFDYHYFHLQRGGPRSTETIVPDTSERYRNYLCLPEGKHSWLNA